MQAKGVLKHRSKIKKASAQVLGGNLIVEYKVYVPRGLVNTSFFNIYRISGETDSFFQVEPVPIVELQIVRNHLAKAKGESEWSFDFLYSADEDNTWIALGALDKDTLIRNHAETFIKIIQNREDDFKKKIEARKQLMAERRVKQKQEVAS